MKIWTRMITVAALMLTAGMASAAQQELAGMWQGKLAVDPKTSLTIQITFAKDAKGAYTAVLNSPDNPALKNTPASNVTWDGSNLKLQVPALQGSYSGALKGGSLDGQWTQPGSNLPLVLAPYQKPVLTKQAASQLAGGWFGKVKLGGTEATAQFRFTDDGKGGLTGTLSLPETGASNIPLSDIEFANGNLSLRIPQAANGQYIGTVTGSTIKGVLKVPAPGVPPDGAPLELKKGDFVPPVYALKLDNAAYAAVAGKWEGNLEVTPPNGQKVSLPLVMRITTNANGQYVGFLDSPNQGAKDLAINEATLVNGTLTIKVNLVGGTYAGKVSGNTMTGTWTQGANSNPLTLTRQP